MSDAAPEKPRLPPGFHHAYWFALFNALSFQIVLSSPMVLYAKSLGGSATVLGVVVSMMPLLVIFQIPAAQYIPRLGFRRFVYAGWGIRVAFIFAMAAVPLLGAFLDRGTQLALLLFLLFGFNLSRGISSCAWLPWITSLVPESIRGRYLARDAAVVNLGSIMVFLLAALFLGSEPHPYQFSLLFAFSAVAGAASLSFLKRIPDVPVPQEPAGSTGEVPWGAILRHAPFQRLLVTVMLWAVVYGGMQAFPVAFLKTEAALSEGRILLLSTTLYLGGMGSLWLFGSRLDAAGSKPVLALAFGVYVLILGGWWLMSGKALQASTAPLIALLGCMGLFSASANMAFTRLAMASVPTMGRNHFFALFSVAWNVTQGVAPILWGMMIDAIGEFRTRWGGVEWNRYSIFFAAAALVTLAALCSTRRLVEPKAASFEELLRDLLLRAPMKFWFRLWPRG
ncbi:MAG: MFS transporter [Verrucomicrobiae bacterium]|nr:MFS transporter [Verrucomicrobiae bacterium]